MRLYGQTFNSSLLEEIQGIVDNSPRISRRCLSRSVCELLNWHTNTGQLQEGTCRKALVKLHRANLLHLPEIEQVYSFSNEPVPDIDVTIPEVICSLADLGDIEISIISSRKSYEAKVWKALINRYHYLGNRRLCGGQIRYLIKSSKYGYLGALSFNSGLYALHDRDVYIGWSESARIENLSKVILNSRFLILPSVHVQNLASHVLALAARRLREDWESRYHVSPVLIETFVDPTRFDGACYKAANWISAGSSAGRWDGVKKDIYLFPLVQGWRERLCQESPVHLGEIEPVETPQNWMQEEFGTCRLHDKRLKERLYSIADNFYNRPLANIPEACGSYASSKGSYRFFCNKKVTMDIILTPHIESTIQRIKKHPVILAPQDTTTLRYLHPATTGLGPIGNTDDRAVGMLLHDTLAFTPNGTPLGILDAQCWVRDLEDRNKSKRRKLVPIDQKESCKWLRSFQKTAQVQKQCPDTMIVSMGDRESDIYDLFVEAQKDPNGPKLLIRSDKSRNRKLELQDNGDGDEQAYLWSYMDAQPIAGILQIHVPKREDKSARDTSVQVKFSQVTLIPPKKSAHKQAITAWAVYLFEADNKDTESRIEWLLVTTVPVGTFEDAKEKVEWYSGRWGIEIYHRTLKSGCRITDRQLGTANGLQACLGVDMVVAWRIYHLTMLGREVPDHPCTVFFEDVEWKALFCYANKTPVPPATAPTLKETIRILGKIGGHLGRTADGMPGTECIWRGIQRLDIAVDMYIIFTGESPPEIRNSYTEAMHYNNSGP